jgi:hypothetical protein
MYQGLQGENLTRQEIFDYVLAYIRKQGQPSMFGDCCQYLTPGGLRCAVGCLLSDEENANCVVGDPADRVALPARFVNHRWFLTRMQEAHDVASALMRVDRSFLDEFNERMRGVAEFFNLKYTEA